MIVWGGYSNMTQYGDGAAYNPQTRTWTKIAASPLVGEDSAMSVWTGKDMLIFGGSGTSGSSSEGAAYDPATNTWRELAPIPRSLGGNLTGSGSYAVWTGKVMVAWGFFGNGGGAHGGGSLAAATYNPATNSWTTGTVAPAQAPLFGDAIWTGKEMIIWGSSVDSHSRLEGLAYDPATGKWSTLPASPLGSAEREAMLAVWTGRYLVVGGGDGGAGLQKDAAAYDPVTDSWMRLPDAPVGLAGGAGGGGGRGRPAGLFHLPVKGWRGRDGPGSSSGRTTGTARRPGPSRGRSWRRRSAATGRTRPAGAAAAAARSAPPRR